MSRKDRDIIEDFHKHLNEHEPLRLALTEAVCNFYYANVSEKDVDVNSEEWKIISNLYSTLWCEIPDWRYRFKAYLDRYSGERITNLPIDSKPNELINLTAQFNLEKVKA